MASNIPCDQSIIVGGKKSKKAVKFDFEKCPLPVGPELSPSGIPTWPSSPPPCHQYSSDPPRHQENYDNLVQSMKERNILGLRQLEYIVGRGKYTWRVADRAADACKADLESIGVRSHVIDHFCVFPKEGTAQGPESSGRQESQSTGTASYGPDYAESRIDRPEGSATTSAGSSAGQQNLGQHLDYVGKLIKKGKRKDKDRNYGSLGDVSISTSCARSLY